MSPKPNQPADQHNEPDDLTIRLARAAVIEASLRIEELIAKLRSSRGA